MTEQAKQGPQTEAEDAWVEAYNRTVEEQTKESVVRCMTVRVRAAIELRVPDSGLKWLDKMIKESLHLQFSGQALMGSLANPEIYREICRAANETGKTLGEVTANSVYPLADAMVKEGQRSD